MSIITVTWCNNQGRLGYEVSVIDIRGKEIFHQHRIGDEGSAAAVAINCRARYKGRIVGANAVMKIINGQ